MTAAEATTTPEHLLTAHGLTKTYVTDRSFLGRPTATLTAVDGVDLNIEHGSILGLVGESGSGKSTLARLLLRLEDVTSGKIVFDGQDITDLSGAELRRRRPAFQMVFQDPSSSLPPSMAIGEILDEPLRFNRKLQERERAETADDLLERVGLQPRHRSRYPHQMSGGQQQRVGIARALASDPRLLVCDEAVSALDISVQGQILNLLMDLQEELSLTILFISHDLAVVRHVAETTAVMYAGKIVEMGPARRVHDEPEHDYTRRLLEAIPDPRRARR